MSENPRNLPGENIYETILQDNPLRIFERKSAKEYSKEIQRKKIQKKTRERIFEKKIQEDLSENLLWGKIEKGIKAFIAFSEALDKKFRKKNPLIWFFYGPA